MNIELKFIEQVIEDLKDISKYTSLTGVEFEIAVKSDYKARQKLIDMIKKLTQPESKKTPQYI